MKEIARKHGVYATFMPKPLVGRERQRHARPPERSSSGEQNAFFDPDDDYHLSADGEGLHRRAAAARARDHLRHRPSG